MELREELEMELCFLVVRLYAKLSYIHYAPAADFFHKTFHPFMVAWFNVSLCSTSFVSSSSLLIVSRAERVQVFFFLEFRLLWFMTADQQEGEKKKTDGVKQNTWNLFETSEWKTNKQSRK